MEQSFLVLGREPSVSFAEVFQYLKGVGIEETGTGAVVISTKDDLAKRAASLFGGVPKAGRVIARLEAMPNAEALASLVREHGPSFGKITFSISSYSLGARALTQREIKPLGLSVKKILVESGRSVRFVESKSGNLSSVDVVKNRLLDRGVELCVLVGEGTWVIGATASVQPFADYSERDYGRPGRNASRGMLPPKLARSLVNMSNTPAGGVVFDPFCGSGTVLQEALLLGYKAIGSDADAAAVQDTRVSLEWLAKKEKLPEWRVEQHDARSLTKKFPGSLVDAIVSELYLGPSLSGTEKEQQINVIAMQLGQLYTTALARIHQVLKPRGRAVLVWPYFKKHGIFVETFSDLKKSGWLFVEPYPVEYQKLYALSRRDTLTYGRLGQHVYREIVILERV